MFTVLAFISQRITSTRIQIRNHGGDIVFDEKSLEGLADYFLKDAPKLKKKIDHVLIEGIFSPKGVLQSKALKILNTFANQESSKELNLISNEPRKNLQKIADYLEAKINRVSEANKQKCEKTDKNGKMHYISDISIKNLMRHFVFVDDTHSRLTICSTYPEPDKRMHKLVYERDNGVKNEVAATNMWLISKDPIKTQYETENIPSLIERKKYGALLEADYSNFLLSRLQRKREYERRIKKK